MKKLFVNRELDTHRNTIFTLSMYRLKAILFYTVFFKLIKMNELKNTIKFIKSTFLKENTVKLITDNIFPSDKIRSRIDLPLTINDIRFDNS